MAAAARCAVGVAGLHCFGDDRPAWSKTASGSDNFSSGRNRRASRLKLFQMPAFSETSAPVLVHRAELNP